MPDTLLGEKIVIIFEKEIPLNVALFFKKLSKYERPKEVFFLNNFKRVNGKVNRENIKKELLNKLRNGK